VGRRERTQSWITIATSLAALMLSISNFVALRSYPEVTITLPNVVRIAQGEDVWFYMQPTLSAREKTDKVEVFTEVELHIEAIKISMVNSPSFFWDESGAFNYDSNSNALTYVRTADPSPLPVSPEKPQQPLMLFNSLNWNFSAGRYDGSLTFNRANGGIPLLAKFCLILSSEGSVALHKAGQYGMIEFRRDISGARKATRQGCYELSPTN
jgi:hypothetical protein